MAGGECAQGTDIYFNPNIPTEEVYTSPMKGKAEGIVYSTKPLSYQGQLIDNFSIRFENGKAVEAKAEVGEELLRVEKLSRTGYYKDVSINVRAGEIVGLTGLVGAGRSETMQCVFGLTPGSKGTVTIDGALAERIVRRPLTVKYSFYEDLVENVALTTHPIPMLILHGEGATNRR